MTALEALLSLPGAPEAARGPGAFRNILDVIVAAEKIDGYTARLDDLVLAAAVFQLCAALDKERALSSRHVARHLRPVVVCTDPTRCPKGDRL